MSKSKEYWQGFRDGGNDAKRHIGSLVLVFDDCMTYEDRRDVAALLERGVRGVAKVLPVAETHYHLMQWREIVEALGVEDTSDDHAHECALSLARSAAESHHQANKLYEAFFSIATEEQQRAASAMVSNKGDGDNG